MFRKYCPSLFDHWSFNSAFNEQKTTKQENASGILKSTFDLAIIW